MAIAISPDVFAEKALIAEKIFTSALYGPDGLEVGFDGAVYVANWGHSGDGKTVVRIGADGAETVLANGLNAPDGLALGSDGSLFVSCHGSGEIVKIAANGKTEIAASGLDHPSDICFGPDGLLYISVLGNYNGTKVLRLSPDGTLKTFAEGLFAPLGLVFGRDGTLYVSSFVTGEITAIDRDGKKRLFAVLPKKGAGSFQYLALDDDGNLYCPSYGDSIIYRIGTDGKVSALKLEKTDGTGISHPNSIFIRERVLYFTEFNSGQLFRARLQ